MDTLSRSRLDGWMPAILFVTGSALFLGAGRQHPQINASLGAVGSPQFYRAFAAHMLHMPNWGSVHLGILLGPVFWALGAAGIARLLVPHVSALAHLASSALMLSAALWSVAFVLDGFADPKLAGAIASAGSSADAEAIRAFSVNQLTMARLGMLSFTLSGVSMLSFAGALVIGTPLRSWQAIVGASGGVLGAWVLSAALRGEFDPGPFTSPWWTYLALCTGIWFALLGAVAPRLGGHRDATAEARDTVPHSGYESDRVANAS